jgi:ABC-type multidrug transport system fused ATPase/permease subunit
LNAYQFFLKIFREDPRMMGGLVFLSVIASFLEAFGISIVLPVFARLLSEDSFNDGRIQYFLELSGLATLNATWLLILIPIVFIIKGGFAFVVGLLIPRLAIKIEEDVRRTLMFRILSARWDTFHTAQTGSFVNILNKESQSIVTATKYFCRFITDLAEAIVLFLISLLLSPIVVGLGIFFGVGSILATQFLIRRTHRLREHWVRVDNQLNSVVIENLENAKLIKIMDSTSFRLKLFLKQLYKSSALRIRIERYKAFLDSYQEPVKIMILSGAVLLILGSPNLNNTDSFVSLLLLYRTTGRILNLQGARRTLAQTIPSVAAALELSENLHSSREVVTQSGELTLKDGVQFTNVFYGYSDDKYVLEDVNLGIPENQITALVGKSGAGKTTLADLLLGLIDPTEGVITVGGERLDAINKALWRSQIGFVPQDTALFNDTVSANIDLGRSLPSDDLVTAAKNANAHEFIISLEDGYETRIGDRGIRLSGGQRQRLSLARALAGRPRLIVLDEATSALDRESEHAIRQALNNLKTHLTIILIAHNMQLIQDADMVVFIRDGKIDPARTVSKLLVTSEAFNQLYESRPLA